MRRREIIGHAKILFSISSRLLNHASSQEVSCWENFDPTFVQNRYGLLTDCYSCSAKQTQFYGHVWENNIFSHIPTDRIVTFTMFEEKCPY